ncbi:hypothetical protein [Roseibacillus persicicus]|uniref:hypothetical protein n=1 Tax=Roseibacillus persicicus TaxID=454148 RepID=UPI00167C15A0|nr:hypothetical protein [Roseibacillus persicicus]
MTRWRSQARSPTRKTRGRHLVGGAKARTIPSVSSLPDGILLLAFSEFFPIVLSL